MPEELRRLFFNKNEVVHALTSYRAAHAEYLPDGTITHLDIEPDRIAVKIQVKYFASINVMAIDIPIEALAEPLVNFCIEHDIPLPRAGNRHFSVSEDRVVFEIDRGYDGVQQKETTAWRRLQSRSA